MADDLTYNIGGQDDLSEIFRRLESTVKSLQRTLSSMGEQAKRAGADLTDAENPARTLGDDLESAGRKAQETGSRLKNAGSDANTMGERIRSGASSMASFVGNIAANAVSNIVSMVGQGLKSLAELAVGTAASNQTAQISFEVMLGSARKAKDFLGQLQQFAAATPFDLPSLKDAASRLLSVGTNAKDVIPIMTALGNAAAGMGTGTEGINRAVYALQQIKLSGVVHEGDIMQLTDAGIPVLDALATKFHTTVKKIKEDVSANKITSDDIFGAIEGQMGPGFARVKGMMDKQSATLSGVWSTFKDNASQAIGQAFAPAVPLLTNFVNMSANALPKMINGIIDAGKRLVDIFKGTDLAKQIGDMWAKFKPEMIANFKKAFEDLFNTISKHKQDIAFLIEAIATGFMWLATNVLPMVVEAISTIIGFAGMMSHEFQIAIQAIGDVLGWFVHQAAVAFGWIPGLGPKLKQADKDFQNFKDGVNNSLNGIKRDIPVNINVKVNGPNWAPQVIGGISIGGHQMRAHGGPVSRGSGYIVGENGPEYFVPDRDGTIVPNGKGAPPAGGGLATMAAPQAIVIQLTGGDSLLDALIPKLRARVLAYGGNVQAYLGRS